MQAMNGLPTVIKSLTRRVVGHCERFENYAKRKPEIHKGIAPMLPKARTDKITVRQLAEETLVYDQERNKAHCLNPTSAFIWKHCDGKTPLPKLAALVEKELGIDNGQAVVRLALEQLHSRNLLERPIVPLCGAARLARRDILKKLAVAAGALPIIMTITAKGARVGASAPATLPSLPPSPCGGLCRGVLIPAGGGFPASCSGGLDCTPAKDQTGKFCVCNGMTVANGCAGTCS
jgi:hypothetical protein